MSNPKKVLWSCLFHLSFFPATLLASPSAGRVIIPLYMEPGATWDTLIAIHERHPNVPLYAIINPDNGPGSSYDSLYAFYINRLKSSGIKVLGYVYTNYGARPHQEVETDIQHHRDWYNVDGIFLDEMASEPGYENYYQGLKNYSYSLGLGFVMGNPGIDTRPSYVGDGGRHDHLRIPWLSRYQLFKGVAFKLRQDELGRSGPGCFLLG